LFFKIGLYIIIIMDRIPHFTPKAGQGRIVHVPIGIINAGNTCYMNSCIQLMKYALGINQIATRPESSNSKPHLHNIVQSWNNINQRETERAREPMNPVPFMEALQKYPNRPIDFMRCEQHDAVEFLVFVMECFHNYLARPYAAAAASSAASSAAASSVGNKYLNDAMELIATTHKKEYSPILALFYGIQFTQIIRPPAAGHANNQAGHANNQAVHTLLSNRAELFMTLHLPINEAMNTLEDCIKAYFSPTILSGENAWLNEKTGKKETVMHRNILWELPPILIIHLKRHQYSNHGHKCRKFIDYPVDADFSTLLPKLQSRRSLQKYSLYGVCYHHGTGPNSGHYTAAIKTASGEWWMCNDTAVYPLDPSQIVSPNACCLIYRLCMF
jgi:ubiquitin C-terminal hydrolase